MRRYFSVFLFSVIVLSAVADSNVSRSMAFRVGKEVKPAIIQIVPGSVKFVEASGNNAIDANEQAKITMQIVNSGTGEGVGCEAVITAQGATNGLSFASRQLSIINVGATQTIEFPIRANINTVDGDVTFKVQVTEPHGYGTEPYELSISTRKFAPPFLQVVDYTITDKDGSSVLEKHKLFDLQILIQNTQHGKAENVEVSVKFPEGFYSEDNNDHASIRTMEGGKTKSLVYSSIIPTQYASEIIPVKVHISEKYGKYAKDTVINLKLNQTLASNKINIDAKEETFSAITIASLTSDVDKNIPVTDAYSENTYAVIIANEDYSAVSKVPYARNDGDIFSKYCSSTLGIPEKQIRFISNATKNQIVSHVNWLKEVIQVNSGEANVIFYYAGHGIPDEATGSAYLLPVDGYGNDLNSACKLDDIYAALGEKPAKSVTIFLDACFSGAKRDGNMIASARGVAIKVRGGQPRGNMVVFSASNGDQTAGAYNEQGHGLFTYFLLKKLQDTNGTVTLGDLSSYITQKVQKVSLVETKLQTPTVIPSAAVGDAWKDWTLR